MRTFGARIAERHLGAIADHRYGFGEVAPLEAVPRDARLREVRSRTISRIMQFAANTWLLRGNTMALVTMSAAGK
jgi:hypothetical protein